MYIYIERERERERERESRRPTGPCALAFWGPWSFRFPVQAPNCLGLLGGLGACWASGFLNWM